MNTRRLVALSLLAPLASARPAAQDLFLPTVEPGLPDVVGDPRFGVFADLGGSPEPDLLVRTVDGLELFLSSFALAYVNEAAPAGGVALPGNGPVAIGDVDGDGHLDCVVARMGDDISASSKGSNVVLLGDGTGAFTEGQALPNDQTFGKPSVDVVLEDLDADGDVDRVEVSRKKVRVHENGPLGAFEPSGQVLFDAMSEHPGDLASLDVEQDGDRDLVVAQHSATAVLIEMGPGLAATAVELGAVSDRTAVGDVDGDGDDDLLLARANSGNDHTVMLDQAGTYVASQILDHSSGPAIRETYLVDLDTDGDLDVLLARNSSTPAVHDNLTGGTFSVLASFAPFPGYLSPYSLPMADLDGDGDLDGAAVRVVGGVVLLLGDGAGQYEAVGRISPIQLPSAGAVGDIDGDGFPDVYSPRAGAGPSLRYLNDGFGGLDATPSAQAPFAGIPRAVDMGDLDGDGDLDAYVALGTIALPPDLPLPAPTANQLALGDGLGDFSTAPASAAPVADYPSGVHLFDADGDGDLDAFVACSDVMAPAGPNRLELNDGNASFTDAPGRLPAEPGESGSVAVADFDADGDLDLLLGEQIPPFLLGPIGPEQPLYFENTGTGKFVDETAHVLPILELPTLRVFAGDLDADGDVDAYLLARPDGSPSPTHPQADVVLLGNGAGALAPATGALPATTGIPRNAALGDFDGDGDLDLVRSTTLDSVDAELGLYENDGSATFADAGPLFSTVVHPADGAMAAVDLDRDGDLDLVTADRTFHSARRELFPLTPANVGKDLVLQVRSESVPGSYLIAYAAGVDVLDLGALGLLRLDLTTPFAVASGGVLEPHGGKQVSLSVPASPALAGTDLYWQALAGGPPHFTRAMRTTIGTF